jgi:photosystem II stability/assembly factor-like uncharacterized protein
MDLIPGGAFTSLWSSGDTIYAGSDSLLYYSFDSGNNWEVSTPVPDVEYGILAIQPVPGGIFIGTALKGVFYTTDFGTVWQPKSSGLTNSGAMEIRAFTVRGDEIFVATVGGGVYKNSISNPGVWNHFSEGIPWNTSWTINSIKNIDGDLFAGGGVNAYYYRNKKNTTVWEEIPFDWFIGEANGILAFEKYSGGIVATSHLAIYKSMDGGDTWLKQSPGVGIIENSSIVVSGKNIVMTLSKVARFYIYHSSDSGVSWWRDDMQSGSVANAMTICGGKIWVGRNDGLYYKPDNLTDIKEPEPIPQSFTLMQNHPNPFNGSTIIEYTLPTEELVTIQLYDITGKMVKQLLNEQKSAGKHRMTFNSGDLTSGIYFYQLRVKDINISKKLVILK